MKILSTFSLCFVAVPLMAHVNTGELRLKVTKTLEIRSAIPVKRTPQLAIAPINTVVQVSDAGTLLDPNRPSFIMQIGSAQIEDRVGSLPLPRRTVGAALSQFSGHFPDSQDKRNAVRTRFQYQVTPRIWLATGLLSGSGLPFEFEDEQSNALAQYGPAVVSRLNFDRGRVDPLCPSKSLSE